MEKQGKSRKGLVIGIIVAVVVLAMLAVAGWFLFLRPNGDPGETTAPSTEGTTAPVELTYELYWNVDRKDYVATGEDAGLTLREPKEDGYYHVIFAKDGEQIELPVIDRRTLLKVDSTDMMQLVFDENGVIIDVIFTADLPLEVIGQTGWYIQSMGGGGKTIKINSSKNYDGMDETFKITEETGIYDMSGRSEFVGAKATLQKDDRIYTVANSEGDITHIFVFEREGIKQYKMQHCEYCDKEVQWENWFTQGTLPTTTGHYWLDSDITMNTTAQLKEGHTVCLDLNGHYVKGRSGWRIITTFNAASHLAIFDYSEEKTGKLESFGKGIDQGGCVWIRFGTGHLYGGTYVSSGENDIAGGAINSASGTILNIYEGVVIKGGKTMNGQGGGAFCTNGTVNMYGGIIEGGVADRNIGGTVLVTGGNAVFNMYGGIIRNGESRGSNGGTVGISGKAVFNMYGGSIYGGRSYQNDKGQNGACGNVYIGANATMNMSGGTIYGGTCHKYNGEQVKGDARGNIFNVNGMFNMSGGRVYGYAYAIDTDAKKDPQATMRISGSAQIWGAKEGEPNLTWSPASKIVIGTLWNGAKISVGAKGVFTGEVPEGYEKYFLSDNPVMQVIRNDEGKLELFFDEAPYIVQHCICGDPNGTGTACAAGGHKIETWRPYMDVDAAPWDGGFWYLLQDITISGGHAYADNFATGTGVIGYNISTPVQVALDLNGHKLTGQSGHRLFRLEPTAAHTLIITDTSEEKDGRLVPRSGEKNANQGMAIWMRSGSNRVDIYGGIIDGSQSYVDKDDGGAMSLCGVVNLYGGTYIGTGSDRPGTIAWIAGGKTTISGDVTFVNSTERTDAFFVGSGKKLYITGGNINADSFGMGAGARLAISGIGEQSMIIVDAPYGRLTSIDASAYLPYFKAAKEGDSVKLNDDKTLALVGPNDEGLNDEGAHPSHCACGKTEAECPLDSHEKIQGEWLPWDGKASITESGNYYLTQDVPNSTQYWLGAYTNTEDNPMQINLCLHGHSIESNYRALGIGTYLTVNLMNCSETESVLIGQCSTKDSGGVIHIHAATSVLNMFDGITLQPATYDGRVIANGGAVNCGGVFNMYGGTIYGTTVGGLVGTTVYNGNGGAIYVNGNGHFTMYGGELYGSELYTASENKVLDSAAGTFSARGLGGAIHSSGKVELKGGSVYGGMAGDGGAIYAGAGTVSITGGEHYAGVGVYGGGFMKANSNNAYVSMTGGVIDGNNPMREGDTIHAGPAGGGAFMLWDANMTLGGDAVIKNCYTSNEGGAIKVASTKAELIITGNPVVMENGKGTKADHVVNNIYLVAEEELIAENLGDEAEIGITMAVPGVFTKLVVAEGDETKFIPDNEAYEVKMTTSDTLALVAKGTSGDIVDPNPPTEEDKPKPEPEPDSTHADHCVCGGAEENSDCDHSDKSDWKPLTGATITASGKYYLTKNQTSTMTIGNGTDAIEVTICLNGQNINIPDWRAIRVTANATLNIVNCKPSDIGGMVKSTGGNNDHSAVIMVQSNGVLNVYDNVTMFKTGNFTISGTGAVSLSGNATMNMYGGEIRGCKVNGSAGAISVASGSVFNMYDGTIIGGQAANGGSIQVSGGTFNMYGGTVKNGQATTGGNINLNSEAAVVNIYGGVVEGGTSKGGHGGNISLQNGAELNILGGIVRDGQALPADGVAADNKDGQDKNGGNISVVDTKAEDKEGVATIGGNAQIIGGNGDRGGNIFVHSGLLVVKDEASVTGGTARNKGWGGGCDNIQINSTASAHAAVSGKPVIDELRLGNANLLDVTGLTKDAKIGISKANGTNKGVFTAPVDAELLQAFSCKRFNVALNAEGALELVDKTFEAIYHCVCGKVTEQGKHCDYCNSDVVAWQPWTDTTTAPYLDGYWYLPYDLDLTNANHKYEEGFSTATAILGYTASVGSTQVNADVNVYIDLNGSTMKTKPGHRGFRMEPSEYARTLTITDSSANKSGKIVASTVNGSDQGMLIWSRKANQKITIWGGTLDASAVTVKTTRGGSAIEGSCSVYLYGGKIIGGKTVDNKGDGIWVAGDVYLFNDAKVVDGTGSNAMILLNANRQLIIDASWTFQSEPLSIRTQDADGVLLIKGSFTLDQAKIFKFHNLPAGFGAHLEADGVWIKEGAGNLGGGTVPEVPDVPVVPDDPNHKTHCVCGGSDEDCAGHKDVEGAWQAWDGKSNITSSGNYYLTQDVTGSTQYWLGAVDNGSAITINLCLNGHSIDSNYRVFAIGPATTVNLMNCGETSTLTGICANNDHAGVLRVHAATSTLNMYDNIVIMGKKMDGRNVGSGGAVGVYGIFNMYGGEITGGSAGWGGNINVQGVGAQFNMYDGIVSNGTATANIDHGGNLYVLNGATANILGGTIKDGVASGNGDANGGNIAISHNANTTSYLTIGGDAVISGGKANRAGSIFLHSGTVRIEGNAQILNGTVAKGSASTNGGYANGILVNNSFTGEKNKLTVSGNVSIEDIYCHRAGFTVENLQDATIGVSTSQALVATNAISAEQFDCFACNDIRFEMILNADNKIEFVAKEAVTYCLCGAETELGKTCESCGSEVLTWLPWEATDLAPYLPGNWYLTSGLNLAIGNAHSYSAQNFATSTALIGWDADGNNINEDVVVNVNLNGQTITGRINHRIYRLEPNGDYARTLTITDTTAGGIGKLIPVTSATNTNQGMAVWLRSSKHTFNLYAGTIDAGNCTVTTSNGAAIASEGTVNLYGGTVIGGTATKGGAISSNGNVTMSGDAFIVDGVANLGGGIRINNATLTMSDNAAIMNCEGKTGGGGVILEGTAQLVMSDDAIICNNTTNGFGGGVYVGSVQAGVTLSGRVWICDNFNQSGADDLWLWKVSDPTITIGEGGLEYNAQDEVLSAKIGIGSQVGFSEDENAPTVIAGPANLTATAAACFYANEEGWMFSVEENGLCLRKAGSGLRHCVCGDPTAVITEESHPCYGGHNVVLWEAWPYDNVAPFLPGNWYLAEDLDLTGKADYEYSDIGFAANTALIGRDEKGNFYTEDVVVNVDLNGKTITGENNHRVYRMEPNDAKYTLNITDSVGGGKIKGVSNNNNQNQGMAIWTRGANCYVNVIGVELDGSAAYLKQGSTAGKFGGTVAIEGGYLNLYDAVIIPTGMPATNPTEKLRCAGAALSVGGVANVNIYGQTVIYGGTTSNAGAVYLNGASVVCNMYDGVIYSGKVAFGGGALKIQGKATFNMMGGVIDGKNPMLNVPVNSDANGGAVFVEGSFFNMSGDAKIVGCTAKTKGGAVILNGAASRMTMTDNAEISGNALTNNAANGAGIHVNTAGATVTVSGNAKVTGNSNTSGECNIMIAVNSAAVTIGEGGLGADAKLGITMQIPGAFTSNAAKAYASSFYADAAESFEIVAGEGDVLELSAK